MANSGLPTLCEVAYDQLWEDIDSSSRVHSFRGVPVTARNPPHARFNGYGWSHNVAQSVMRDCVSVQCFSDDTYCDYLRNYYWEHPSLPQNGGALTIPTLPPRSQTTHALHGGALRLQDVEGAPLDMARGWDSSVLSLPNLSRSDTVELDWRSRRLCSKPKLQWFDSLNAWVPVNKTVQDSSRDGEESFPRRASSSVNQSSSQESSRKSRTVRFEPPPHACQLDLPLHLPPDQLSQSSDVPRADWESEGALEEAVSTRVEPVQAREDRHPGGEPLVEQATIHVDQALEPVLVTCDAATWCEEEGEGEEEDDEDGAAKSKPPAKPKKDKTGASAQKPHSTGVKPKPAEKPAPTTGPKAPKPPPTQAKSTVTKPTVKMVKPAKPKTESKEKKEPKPVAPKPVPKPRPVKDKKVTPPEESDEEPEDKPIPLPISKPEDMIWTPTPEPENDPSPLSPEEPRVPLRMRSPVKKKEKLPPPPPRRPTPSPPRADRQARVSFLHASDDEGEDDAAAVEEVLTEEALEQRFASLLRVTPSLPHTGSASPTPRSHPGTRRSSLRSQLATPRGSLAASPAKSRWGQKQRDRSLREQAERERLAEERRRRHAQMVERHSKGKGAGDGTDGAAMGGGFGLDDARDSPSPVLDGFLSKYCILNSSTSEQYRYTFEQLDEGSKGYLTEEETAYGLRAINPSLSTSERTYLYRVMKLAGHKMKVGTDFRLFSILAALSQRVSRLDDWARSLLAQVDYQNLERKMFLCKTLWEVNVDEDRGDISLDQLVVELRAGGVSPHHETEVRHKLAAHPHLDFLDFLLYVPLFIAIHQTVLTDPLTASWEQ